MRTANLPGIILSLGTLFALSQPNALATPEYVAEPSLADEIDLPVVQWRDTEVRERGIVVAIHGLTLYSETFDAVAKNLASKGYSVYACDMRGFGKWIAKSNASKTEKIESDLSDEVNFEQTKEDLLKMISHLRKNNSDKQLYCMGESLGANLALWVASEHPKLTDGLILSAVCYKANIHPRLRWPVDAISGIIRPTHQMKLKPYIVSNLSDDKTVTNSYLHDEKIRKTLSPVKLIKAALTNKYALKNVEQIPVDMPILIVAGEDDGLYKAESLKKLVKKFGSKKTDVHILANKGHLLLEHQEPVPEVQSLIDSWLRNRSVNSIATEATPAFRLAEDTNFEPASRTP